MSPNHRRKSRITLRLAIPVAVAIVSIPAGLALAAGGNGIGDGDNLAANVANPQCTLTVPANPLTAQGLATPYVLNSTAGTTCTENETTGAFVQATILDPATGALSVYDPEVVVPGETGAPVPPVPVLPRDAVVAIWTGFNDNVLKLTGSRTAPLATPHFTTMRFAGAGASQFVNFTQQGYDNSPGFFAVLRFDVARGLVKVPPIGTASDGMACPTTHDFSIADQDPSDNVPVTYTYGSGASNGSDEQLLDLVLGALGCREWTVPLLDPGVAVGAGDSTSTSGLLQEEQASVYQKAPLALIPGLDDFVTNDSMPPTAGGIPDLFMDNLYRAQVGEPPTLNDNDTRAFCENLASAGEPRLAEDAATEAGFPAPAFAMIGTNLANVLAARFLATWSLLNCPVLTGDQSPVQVTLNSAGVASAATYSSVPAPVMTPTTPASSMTVVPVTPVTTTPASTGTMTQVTVYACEGAGGTVSMIAVGTAPACPAGDTPLSWAGTLGG